MPTGYTSVLIKTKDPKAYAEACIRAFAVAIEMRDEPLTKAVPEQLEDRESAYHQENLDKAKAKIDEINAMSDEEAADKAQEEYEAELERLQEDLKERTAIKVAFDETRKLLETFTPPTDEHVRYKEFMIEQLDISQGDADTMDIQKSLETLKPLTAEQWKEKETKHHIWSIEYHSKELEQSRESNAGRNEWLSQLRGALTHFDKK